MTRPLEASSCHCAYRTAALGFGDPAELARGWVVKLEFSGSGRRARGQDTELLHERHRVHDAPVLAHETRIIEPHDVDQLH